MTESTPGLNNGPGPYNVGHFAVSRQTRWWACSAGSVLRHAPTGQRFRSVDHTRFFLLGRLQTFRGSALPANYRLLYCPARHRGRSALA